ncbi:MAG: TonB-dependent receptor [Flavobacteriales bacterium]|nr:TonB-dependent receptor [Flavobacteriales bacterium]MCB9203835.1 TonB-dependent receptor [Flavobacteriales bacterium]
MKKLILSILGLITWCGVSAQDRGTLKGTVSDDATDETLIGANVVMASDRGVGASTDIDGNYSFTLPAGKHWVICSFTGMKPDSVEVNIAAGQTTLQNFVLGMNSEELGTVVISAGKFEQKLEELTVTMNVIKPELIDNRNSTNITSALEQTPGLTIMDEEPQIRSGSGYSFGVGSRVAILVDDLPILNGDIGKAEWSFIPTENVEQIEVIKGASSVLYGSSALSGAINVRTAYPKDKPLTKVNVFTGFRSAILEEDASVGKRIANFFGMDASAANGKKWWDGVANFSGMNFMHSRKVDYWDIVIGGNFLYDHGYIGPHKPVAELDSFYNANLINTGYVDRQDWTDTIEDIANKDVREIRGRFNFNIRKRSKKTSGLSYGLNGNFMRSSKNFSLVWQSTERDQSGKYRSYPGTMTLTEITTFYLDPFVSYVTPRGVQHAFRSRILFNNSDNSNNQSVQSTVYFGEYQIQRTFSKMKDLNLIAGASGSYSQSKSDIFVGGDSSGVNNAKNFSLYMQLDKKFFKSVNVSAGVRGEYFQINNTEFVVRPVFRAGVSWKAGRESYIRGSYGQGYRFPTIAEKYIRTVSGGLGVFPNPDLKPETSWNAELGFKQGFKIGKFMGYFDLVGFWQEFNNSIEFVMGRYDATEILPGFKFLNTGKNRVRGFETSLMGGGQFTKSFGTTVIVGYTYTLPESMEPENIFYSDSTGGSLQQHSHYSTSIDTMKILKYRFQHLANLDIEFTYKKWSLGYTFRYYSYMRNVDKILYSLDSSVKNDFGPDSFDTGVIEDRGDTEHYDWDSSETVHYTIGNKHPGNYVMDARISYQIADWLKAAFIVNNFLNREYSLRPLKMEQPRTASIQFTVKV